MPKAVVQHVCGEFAFLTCLEILTSRFSGGVGSGEKLVEQSQESLQQAVI